MFKLPMAFLLLFFGVAEAQYVNPYAIKPIQPIKPIGSSYTTPSYTTPSYTTRRKATVPTARSYTTRNPRRNTYSSDVSSYSYTNPATVVSPAGEYLGNTSSNKYDPDSINNPYGKFGSKYSNESSNNPYATNAPQLYGQDGSDRGNLSANRYDTDSIENPYSLKHDKPLATNRQLMRTKLINAYEADPDGFLNEFTKLSSTKQSELLKLLQED